MHALSVSPCPRENFNSSISFQRRPLFHPSFSVLFPSPEACCPGFQGLPAFFFFCLCPYKGSTRDLPGGPVAKKNLAIPTQGANVPWIADQETRSHMLQLKIPRATPQSQCHQLNKYLLKEKEKAQRNEFLQKWGCKSIFLFKTKFLNCCYNVCETTANNFRSKINIGCAFSKSRTKQASV